MATASVSVGSVLVNTIYVTDNKSYKSVLQGISGIQKQAKTASMQIKGLGKTFAGLGAAIASAFAVKQVVAFGKEVSKTAVLTEAHTQYIYRLMGKNSDAFMDWAKTQAIAYNMSQAEAIKYGAVYSNLMSTFTKDSAQTTSYVVDLLKASSVVASATGRSMEDVMWRIRSGMLGNTEAIEDLGINVYVNLLETTDAFRKFAGDKSWNQLDFQTQQQIRYFGILEQIATKFGSEVNKNTNSSLQQLAATLGDVKLNLGQAFLPIINTVIPILTQFAQKLVTITELLKNLSIRVFGNKEDIKQVEAYNEHLKSQAEQVYGVGEALEETTKEAKKTKKAMGSLASFDELNLVSKPTADATAGSGGSVGAGGSYDLSGLVGGIESVEKRLPSLESAIKSTIDRVNGWLNDLGIDSSTVANIVKHSESIRSSISSIFSDLNKPASTFLKGLLSDLKKMGGDVGNLGLSLGESLLGGIDKFLVQNKARLVSRVTNIVEESGRAFSEFTTFFSTLSGLISEFFKLETTKQAIADFIAIATELFLAPKELLVSFLADTLEGINLIFEDNKGKMEEFLNGASELLSEVLDIMKTMIEETFDTIASAYNTYIKPTIDNIAEAVSFLVGKLLDFYNNHLQPTFMKIVEEFTTLYERSIKPFVDKLVEVVGKLIFLASEIINKFVAPIVGELIDRLGPIFSSIFETIWDVVNTKISMVMDIGAGLLRSLGGIIDFLTGVFTGDWQKAWDGIKDIFGGVWDSLEGIVKGALNLVITAVNAGIRLINKALTISIPDWDILPNSIQGKTWSINIPEIPKLAKGAVIPPNNEFLAILGDQKSGLNIETPLETMLQAFNAALDRRANSGGGLPPQVNVEIKIENFNADDDAYLRRMARKLKQYLEEELGRTGGGGDVYAY